MFIHQLRIIIYNTHLQCLYKRMPNMDVSLDEYSLAIWLYMYIRLASANDPCLHIYTKYNTYTHAEREREREGERCICR